MESKTKSEAAATPIQPVNSKEVFASEIERTKAKLEKGEHTNFVVPLATGEKPGAVEEGSINGYHWSVKKGQMVNIPVPIAKQIADKYRIEMEAGQNKRIDRDKKVEEALS